MIRGHDRIPEGVEDSAEYGDSNSGAMLTQEKGYSPTPTTEAVE